MLQGGSSAERAVSLMSGAGVLAALQSQGVDAHAFQPQGPVERCGDGLANGRCGLPLCRHMDHH